jgi:hypothetical protein
MLVGLPFSFKLPAPALGGLVAFNALLFGGFVAGARRLLRAGRSLPRETVPFVLFAALAFAIHLLPSSEPRMLLPVIPVLVWLSVQTLQRREPSLAAK